MKLTDELKNKVVNAKENEKVEDITRDTIEDAETVLSDEDLDGVSGGARFEINPGRLM
ncbi:MAG: hypothetical protein II732_07605 [Lachnospiraceae bacterium]|nr:hypothetical protein [Lachnospiraceae bacterium]